MNHLLDRFIYRVTQASEEKSFHLLTFIQPQIDADRLYDELISTNRVEFRWNRDLRDSVLPYGPRKL